MPDEPSRIAAARAEAAKDTKTASDIDRHEERLDAINHSIEKNTTKSELIFGKLELLASMLANLGHRLDMQDATLTAYMKMEDAKAKVLRDQKQIDRENVHSGQGPWRFGLLILAGAVSVGSLLYTIFSK
jgi:hypothetical protein